MKCQISSPQDRWEISFFTLWFLQCPERIITIARASLLQQTFDILHGKHILMGELVDDDTCIYHKETFFCRLWCRCKLDSRAPRKLQHIVTNMLANKTMAAWACFIPRLSGDLHSLLVVCSVVIEALLGLCLPRWSVHLNESLHHWLRDLLHGDNSFWNALCGT